MKLVTYKGHKIDKPDNISMNLVKRLIDGGADYSLTTQNIVDIVANEVASAKLKLISRVRQDYKNNNGDFPNSLFNLTNELLKEKEDADRKSETT